MVEYLERLIVDEKWESALAYAERITADHNSELHEMVVVHRSILRARFKLGDYPGALAAGELVVRLAKEVGDWESYGTACNDMGCAHFITKQYDQAAFYFSEYLSSAHHFAPPLEMLTLVWYNLGCVYRAAKKGAEAVAALTAALQHARRNGDPDSVQGVRLVLVDAKLKAGNLDQLPRLLAQSAHHIRTFPFNAERAVYLALLRVEFARVSGRLRRARTLAVKGLSIVEENPVFQSLFHIQLAMIEQAVGRQYIALDHALAARVYSVAFGRPYLEAEASGLIDRLSVASGPTRR